MPYHLQIDTAGAAVMTADPDLRNFLKIDTPDEDALLDDLIAGLQGKAEKYANRSFTERTLKLTLDRPPFRQGISDPYGRLSFDESTLVDIPFAHVDLPMGPVSSVTLVEIIGDDNAANVLASTEYYLAGDRIVFTSSFPVRMRRYGGLAITYVCGYGASGVDALPSEILVGMRKALKTIYEHREDFVIGTSVASLPDDSLSYFDAAREVMV